MAKYRAVRCLCGHRACKDWHVAPVAAVQGVGFTQRQAEMVANLLNMDESFQRQIIETFQDAKLRGQL